MMIFLKIKIFFFLIFQNLNFFLRFGEDFGVNKSFRLVYFQFTYRVCIMFVFYSWSIDDADLSFIIEEKMEKNDNCKREIPSNFWSALVSTLIRTCSCDMPLEAECNCVSRVALPESLVDAGWRAGWRTGRMERHRKGGLFGGGDPSAWMYWEFKIIQRTNTASGHIYTSDIPRLMGKSDGPATAHYFFIPAIGGRSRPRICNDCRDPCGGKRFTELLAAVE